MNVLGIIPSRYASTRFPGKPLVDIAGKSMIQRVYEQAKKCDKLDEVIVATDDERIYSHVIDFGGKAQMTATDHQSGTDRCAEVIAAYPQYGIAINIQGDEPFIDPNQITKLVSCFIDPHQQIATLIKKIDTTEELHNPNSPKVIINNHSEAIYFSRQALPYLRDYPPEQWLNHHQYYKHIGIYGYRADILAQITKLPVSTLERAERLEQLRWLENGYRIYAAITTSATYAIDTPADLVQLMTNNTLFNKP
jgi:3-deoxy-manno-octulosonate cytidylyltransferase (CMP-KDO synthetase)